MKKIVWIAMIIGWFCFSIPTQAAENTEEIQDEILDAFEFDEMEAYLQEIMPEEKQGFLDMVKNFISGDTKLTWQNLWELFTGQLLYELSVSKTSIVSLLAIALIAALFHNFAGVFKNSHAAEIGFFVLYLLLITICLNSFRALVDSMLLGLESLLGFLKLLGPIYFFAVAIATGSATSVTFYTFILLLVCVVELVIFNILVPVVQLYIMIRILNNLSPEQYLSKLADLFQTLVSWALKTLLGAVIGINLIQGMLNPAIDSVKRSVLTRGGESIPIVGNLLGGTAEVVLGTAKLIQNGIGAVGAMICVIICMSPVVKMVVVTLLYKLTAALVQPISDKRIVGCISSMADGTAMLLKVILTSGVLFLITIAMVANTTT